MDSLFSEEIAMKILEILATATDAGGIAVIIYLLLPLVLALIAAIAWTYGSLKALAIVKELLLSALEKRNAFAKIREEKPKLMSFKGVVIDEAAEDLLRDLVSSLRHGQHYVYASDIRRAMEKLNVERK